MSTTPEQPDAPTPDPDGRLDGRAGDGSVGEGPASADVPSGSPTGDGADASTSAAEPAPAPRPSRYAEMARPQPMRNVLWALGLTVAVVVIVAILFFGVGRDPDRSVPESEQVDVAASAERAQPVADFTLAVPQLPSTWTPKQARFDAGSGGGASDGGPSDNGGAPGTSDQRWSIRYTSPSRALVTLTQVAELSPATLQSAIHGAHSTATVQVAGMTCQVLAGDEDPDARIPEAGLACDGPKADFVVSGQTDREELTRLAEAAAAASTH